MGTARTIQVPCIITMAYLGRTVAPLKTALFWGFSALAAVFILIPVMSASAQTFPAGIIGFYILFGLPALALLVLVIVFAIDLLHGRVLVDDTEFQFVDARVHSRAAFKIPLDRIDSLQWVQKAGKDEFKRPVIYNALILIDSAGDQKPLIEDFRLGGQMKRWRRFLDALNGCSGLAVAYLNNTVDRSEPVPLGDAGLGIEESDKGGKGRTTRRVLAPLAVALVAAGTYRLMAAQTLLHFLLFGGASIVANLGLFYLFLRPEKIPDRGGQPIVSVAYGFTLVVPFFIYYVLLSVLVSGCQVPFK